LIILSAFRNSYDPTPSSIIGALHRKGLSVKRLAENKAIDLRDTSGFWLSRPLLEQSTPVGVRRILCFEPHFLGGQPSEVVGNLFRGLFPFLSDTQDATVAMAILAAGNLHEDPARMLRALIAAASMWMKRGLPIHELRIIEKDKNRVDGLTPVFAEMKKLSAPAQDETTVSKYHVFLSFSSKDANEADTIAKALKSRAPNIQLFDYRLTIDTGKVWQHEIDQAMRACLRMISLLSPSYLSSPECREELSVARLLHKRRNHSFLFPLYVRSLSNDEELPFWLQAISYIDCREGDPEKLAAAANRLDLQANADRHLSESPQ
jgi:tRNA nucleotidyltransferase/poly(A) polymerase